jgi:hypothetical protein
MTRDMDLIRDLLLRIEADPRLDGLRRERPGPGEFGVTEENFWQVAYNLTQLIEAGMVIGETGMRMPIFTRLTWEGHDFLDSVRDPKVWHATKERAKKAGGFTIEILAGIAKDIIKDNLVRIVGAAFGA